MSGVEVVLATRNQHKIREVRRILAAAGAATAPGRRQRRLRHRRARMTECMPRTKRRRRMQHPLRNGRKAPTSTRGPLFNFEWVSWT